MKIIFTKQLLFTILFLQFSLLLSAQNNDSGTDISRKLIYSDTTYVKYSVTTCSAAALSVATNPYQMIYLCPVITLLNINMLDAVDFCIAPADEIDRSVLSLYYEDDEKLFEVENHKFSQRDSLLMLWYRQNYLENFSPDTTLFANDSLEIPDSVFIDRLQKLPTVFEMSYNSVVKDEINRYLNKRGKAYIERMIGRAEYYAPVYEEILDSYNLPIELKNLPIIESAINPNARSYVGAVGMWQFMYYTGRMHGLHISRYIDERRDPIRSTHAAAEYLNNLFARYNDWTLALAAYNCGPGNVNRAIKRSKGKTYWDIYQYLPRETRRYVPRYIAATYLMNYYQQHNLVPKNYDLPLAVDTVAIVNKTVTFDQLSSMLNLPKNLIKSLNPQYLKEVIPAENGNFPLCLPLEYTIKFIELEDSLLGNKPTKLKTEEKPQKKKYKENSISIKKNNNTQNSPSKIHSNDEFVYYTIKKGDNFWDIANKFNGITYQDILKINNFTKNTRINPGDIIKIKVKE